MKKIAILFLLAILVKSTYASGVPPMDFSSPIAPDSTGQIIIEDFDDGIIELESYSSEDEDPDAWELNANITYENSPYSLKLFGNTWKRQNIDTLTISPSDVWQISAYTASQGEIQGFGFADSAHVLFYSFAGSQKLVTPQWMPVYQGNFPEDQWNDYQLPIADDWFALYGYYPKITSLAYVNDKDSGTAGVVYFDQIMDISKALPCVPEVSINYSIGEVYKNGTNKSVDVQFQCEVLDPDSQDHEFLWDFGDENSSTEQDPQHTYVINDDHAYRVLLQVVDPTGRVGTASCQIEVDPGSTSFPVRINFVGDIMLARKYEYAGGIIPTQGVEAIFEPTRSFLGDAADITVANLECPLTTQWQHHPTKSIYFKGSPNNVDGLTYAGIDIVTLANNHVMDYMLPGLQETQSVLRDNNIVFSGAGAHSYEAYLPAFYSKSGVSFAFLASSDRTGQYNNYQPYLDAGYNKPGFGNLTEYHIKKQIDDVKDISDFVVMEFHTGVEYSFAPTMADDSDLPFAGDSTEDEDYSPLNRAPDERGRAIRQYAIDAGADLVICHHPHIAHGVELYHGKLIAHSLGDFVFDLDYPETFPSFILNGNVDESGFYEFELTPIYIDNYIPKRAEGELALHILDDLAQRSRNLDTYLKVDRENAVASVLMDPLNMPSYELETDLELPMTEVNTAWESAPYYIEKTGSISSVNIAQAVGDCQFRVGRDDIWFGNMEDEGSSMWNLNNGEETFCDTVAWSGERSIQHYRDAYAPSNIVTDFKTGIICWSDTLNYSLCGYIKTQNGKNVTIEVQYFEDRSGAMVLGQESIGTLVNGDTPWTYYHHQLTIPEGTEFFNIRLNSRVPDEGVALSWFDYVSLICWESWDKYEMSEIIPTPNDYYFVQAKAFQSIDKLLLNYSETIYEELPVGIKESGTSKDLQHCLLQNFPNPFKPEHGPTCISFSLDNAQNVHLAVYDIKGQLVKVLVHAEYPTGNHNLFWDGKNSHGRFVGAGVYFYQLQTRDGQENQKCILLR